MDDRKPQKPAGRTTRKKTSDTGFSQKARPEKKGYYTQTTDKPTKRKTSSDTGFSQKAKPEKKGYYTQDSETAKKKKAFSETGFSQKPKTHRKGNSSSLTGEKPKRKTTDIGFSQKAKPEKKGYYTQSTDKPYKKKTSDTGFSQKARPEKKGYYTQDTDKPKTFKKNNTQDSSERPLNRRRKTTDSNEREVSNRFFKKKEGFENTDEPKKFGFRKEKTEETIEAEEVKGKPKFGFRKEKTEDRERKPVFRKERTSDRSAEKRINSRKDKTEKIAEKKFDFRNKDEGKATEQPEYNLEKYAKKYERKPRKKSDDQTENGTIRLNRYIANAGICSRRDADLLIESGEIKVNSKIVTEMGYQVQPTDVVKYGSRILNREKMVYVLLNKPKDFITTTNDPEERKTVMDLVKNAAPQRIYPVGRLDRNTTGLLLLTNDGELAEKLTHPSNNIKKLYEIELNKPIVKEDFEEILAGVTLEDGLAEVDELATVSPDKATLGVQIHNGKNRIVRRIFEHFGYDIVRLDRVMYAGLTKKDLPRGNWRYLSEKEVITLKFLL
ncbi:MAG: pseudouridine synthase [Verrucomicrobia bacterium]|nr:pseudouridine synthase [Cytophagales bacterium]